MFGVKNVKQKSPRGGQKKNQVVPIGNDLPTQGDFTLKDYEQMMAPVGSLARAAEKESVKKKMFGAQSLKPY